MREQRLITDTTEIFAIDEGDVLLVGDRRYRVVGHEREARFGLEDPKFWVKRAVDVDSGEKKIVKLSYFESFETRIGTVPIMCFRSPAKEAEILRLVRGHPSFMQGESWPDEKGNVIRVLDIVRGPNFFNYIDSFKMDYADYCRRILPDILKRLVRAFEAIRHLHVNGFRHGDIRNDHIIVERRSGNYVWIDFDYDCGSTENPFGLDIFGLGNILIYAVGRGFHTLHMIRDNPAAYSRLDGNLEAADFSIIHKTRFINLKKLFPQLPGPLNDILMHFSRGANIYYENIEEVIEDINRYVYLTR